MASAGGGGHHRPADARPRHHQQGVLISPRALHQLLGPPLLLPRALADCGLSAAAERRAQVTDAFSGQFLLTVPLSSPRQARAAVVRAGQAGRSWSLVPAAERARWGRRFREAVAARRAPLLAGLPLLCGLGPADAEDDITQALRSLRRSVAAARSWSGRLNHTPYGRSPRPAVVFSDVDDACPLASLLEGALPALLSGVAVVTEVDHRSAMLAVAVHEAARASGLPPHVWQLAVCDTSDGARADVRAVLAEHADAVAPRCCPGGSARPPGLLVLRHDGDAKAAARATIDACFTRAGRKCTATPLVAVHESLLPRFVRHLTREAERFVPVSVLPEEQQRRRYSAWVDTTLSPGASVADTPPTPTWTMRTPHTTRPVILRAALDSFPRLLSTPVGPSATLLGFTAWAEVLDLACRTGPHLSVFTRTPAARLRPQWAGLAAHRIDINRAPAPGGCRADGTV
ncbi:aldehyde dehydrogenase family protein [Streptomyces sp. NPDC045456]|uniref:aldehyde dehydrogenase family protein n=1 Tax=Streptomyces sp. NPDC045456 TaxID=3155254 RepID=UPI0033FA443C